METALIAGKTWQTSHEPHALEKTGTHHTDTQWKAKGREVTKPATAPLIMLLLPATLINKRYSPEHKEFHACASILKPQTNWLQTLLVVYLVKLRLTSLKWRLKKLFSLLRREGEKVCKLNKIAFITLYQNSFHLTTPIAFVPVCESGKIYFFNYTIYFFLVDNSHIWILKCKVALLSTSYTRKEEKEQSTFEWMIRHKFDDGLRFKVTHNEISCKFRNMGSEVRGCKASPVNYLDITKFTSPLTSIRRAFNFVW